MARRNRTSDLDLERDDDIIASLSAPVAPSAPLVTWQTPPENLLDEIEDRRRYHPDGHYRPALDLAGLRTLYDQHPRKTRAKVYDQPAFHAPDRPVLVCVRRKQRREVIFAKRKQKRGAGAKRRRRNYYSNVRC